MISVSSVDSTEWRFEWRSYNQPLVHYITLLNSNLVCVCVCGAANKTVPCLLDVDVQPTRRPVWVVRFTKPVGWFFCSLIVVIIFVELKGILPAFC